MLLIDPGVSRGAIAAVRSLRRAGHTLGVAGPVRGPASRSRTVARYHPVAPPDRGTERFVAEVERVVATHGYELVLAAGDPELLTLSERRSALSAALGAPTHEALVSVTDKVSLAERAAAAGLRTPPTTIPEEGTIGAIELPAIVKTRFHGDPSVGAPARAESTIARSRMELESAISVLRSLGVAPIVQPLTQGELVALTYLIGTDGTRLARVQQRAERIWPRHAGISVRARTEPVAEDLSRRVEALLGDLGWHGLAQVQFIDPGDAEPLLIDINGRVYGSLALAVAAGVDLPRAWVASALGDTVEPLPEPRAGVRYQWLEGDLRLALGSERKTADLLSALRYAPGAAHSIASLRDPLPVVHHLLDLARRTAAKAIRRN